MAVVDYEFQEKRDLLSTWVLTHGAATALIGCAAFWAVVGVSLYLAL